MRRRDFIMLAAQAAVPSVLTPPGAAQLNELVERLAKAPRRRDFKTVPMILTNHEQWDHEALSEVLAYKPVPRQAWDNTEIAGPWLNLMRNALFSATFTTIAFDDSSLRWLEIST